MQIKQAGLVSHAQIGRQRIHVILLAHRIRGQSRNGRAEALRGLRKIFATYDKRGNVTGCGTGKNQPRKLDALRQRRSAEVMLECDPHSNTCLLRITSQSVLMHRDAALIRCGHNGEMSLMKKVLLAFATLALCNVSMAQVGTTVKEGAKATAEKAKEVGDEAKAAVSSEPEKSVDKAKAKVHKAKAHHHAKAAKEAAKEIPK